MKEAYTADLSILPFNAIYCITDPDEAIDFLCKCLLIAIDKHAPIRTKRIKEEDIPAWISEETMKAMHQRNISKKKNKKIKWEHFKANVTLQTP